MAAPEDMIWEVDEDGDGCVSWDEYLSCYERAVADKAGLEPRKLSTLVEFLMLDEEENNWVRRRRSPVASAGAASHVLTLRASGLCAGIRSRLMQSSI